MRTIKLTIEYDGTNYCGWQVQHSRKKSVQGALQEALAGILQEKVLLKGSGRTDAGVHARGQVAHCATSSLIPVANLQRALNAVLPESISIVRAQEAPADFHSRFQASSKIYRYTILNRPYPPALGRQQVYHYAGALDNAAMARAAACLRGRHDFKAFQSSGGRLETIRTVKKISVAKRGPFLYIDIEADGFLYNMVRIVVGTLIEVGRGRYGPGHMRTILRSRDRKYAGPTAPARGLCLMRVRYR